MSLQGCNLWLSSGTIGAGTRPRPDHPPYRSDLARNALDFADYARRQITIPSGEAAFAVTATVLLVSLARDRSSVASEPFNAVIAMLLLAFVSFVGAAIMNALLLGEEEQGPIVARVLFGVTGTQHFRTLFLAWFALRPLEHLGTRTVCFPQACRWSARSRS